MIVDWRSLLSALHIEWRDRGANCRAGNININCPWCQNDPSFHLAISEQREAFYCYREPDRHSGQNFVRLLIRLNLSRDEAARTLNAYIMHNQPVAAPREPISPEKLHRGWNRFEPASASRSAIDYLHSRGINDPVAAVRRYDLRVANMGTWARRLLIPFRMRSGEVETWTGRALHSGMSPKYLTQSTNDPGHIYVPDPKGEGKTTLVICEGPFDALKLALIAQRSEFMVAALTGKDLNAARKLRLIDLAKGYEMVMVVVDADVSIASRYGIISDIAGTLRLRYSGRARLPHGYKDPGELPVEGSLSWLQKERALLLASKRETA